MTSDSADRTPWSELSGRFGDAPRGKAAGVYWLYDAARQLLYVGMGSSPYGRWKGHAKTASWWPKVDHSLTRVAWFGRYQEALEAEDHAIENDMPLHNTKRLSPSRIRPMPIPDGATEITAAAVRSNISEVLAEVELLRQCIFVNKRSRAVAAIVPVELARAVHRVGGPDRAAEILARHAPAEAPTGYATLAE